MQNIVSPILTHERKKANSLQDIIIKKIVEKGAQSPHDIINEISNQKNNQKSVERSVLRAFRTLQLEDKYGRKRIACEYHKKTYGNFRYYHNLTDDGIDRYIEKFGLSPDDFWHMSINLFKKKYAFRYAYENIHSKFIEYENSDIPKSRLEKWTIETLYQEYKERNNINEKIFNPFGSITTINSIYELLRKYFGYNENYFPEEFDYDYWRILLPLLNGYIQNDKKQIKRIWSPNEFKNFEISSNENKEEIISRLKSDNIICTFYNKETTENKITIIGVLFYLVLIIRFYSYEKIDLDRLILKIQEFFPYILNKSIWSNLRKFGSTQELLYVLITPFMKRFEAIFDESFMKVSLESLNRLYHTEQKTHYKMKHFYDSGLKILDEFSRKNNCSTDFYEYLENKSTLPETIMSLDNVCSKLKKLNFVFTQNRSEDSNIFDHNSSSYKKVGQPVSEFITYHFYMYLKLNLDENVWKNFLFKNTNVDKFLKEYDETLSSII